jgi:hypothetical protein
MVQMRRQVNLVNLEFFVPAQVRWVVCLSLHPMVAWLAGGAAASRRYG